MTNPYRIMCSEPLAQEAYGDGDGAGNTSQGSSATDGMEHSATVRRRRTFLMDTFTQARQQLDALLADLEQREQSVAQAAELLSQEPAIAAAWQQGGMAERDRVVMLIDYQLDQLNRGGVNALVLTALRRQVLEVEA